jgi:hypothetical protein
VYHLPYPCEKLSAWRVVHKVNSREWLYTLGNAGYHNNPTLDDDVDEVYHEEFLASFMTSPRSPLGLCRHGAFAKSLILFRFVHSNSSAFSLFLSLTSGPRLSAHSSSSPCRPSLSALSLNPAAPGHDRRPTHHLEMLPPRLNSPSASKPLLNPS